MTSKASYTVEDLCDEVSKYPIIYNSNDPNFRDKRSKARCWNMIAKDLRTTSEAVEKRWKSLRTSYGRHLRAVLNPNVPDPVKGEKNWCKWAKHMERFRDFLQFYERHQPDPEMFQVAADPNAFGHYIGDDTRDTLFSYVRANVTEFFNQRRDAQPEPEPSLTIRKRKSKASETATTPRAKVTSTATRPSQNIDTPVESNMTPSTPVAPYMTPATSVAPYVTPATPAQTYVTPATPAQPYVTPATPVAPFVTPATSVAPYVTTSKPLPLVGQSLIRTMTYSSSQEQSPSTSTTSTRANVESAGAALDAMDHFMLKCSKRLKQLPPDVQADLQIQIAEVITHNEQHSLLKINNWQNK